MRVREQAHRIHRARRPAAGRTRASGAPAHNSTRTSTDSAASPSKSRSSTGGSSRATANPGVMHHPAISTLCRAPRRAPGSRPPPGSALRARCSPSAADPPRPTDDRRTAACATRCARACQACARGERWSSARSHLPQRGQRLEADPCASRADDRPSRRHDSRGSSAVAAETILSGRAPSAEGLRRVGLVRNVTARVSRTRRGSISQRRRTLRG
jgi:hypothetical protein